ncbi:MAG: type I DNA topoisomerase [Patescibacteria group bacterium]
MSLIIVESPTKARTFNRILKQRKLDDKYQVFATMGHFRDLPSNEIAVRFEKNFQPQYEVMDGKKKVVEQLRKLQKEHDEIIFATDPDREGESISYHAAYILGYLTERWPDIITKEELPLKRIVFHEITPKALEEALQHPTEIRLNLVKAQQARRILDRIVGYQLSPLLWKKTGKNWLSAGRVQTVALRLVVEREKEIQAFNAEPYFQIYGMFFEQSTSPEDAFRSKLVAKDGEPFEQKTTISLFDGDYTFTKTTITAANVKDAEKEIRDDSYTITDVREDMQQRFPPPPFTTSLLQQTAYQRYGYPSKLTMRIAQQLYEKGLITYHRTDSFNLSAQFVFRAKDYIEAEYGKEYALEKPRGFRTKSKMAQEAHEAIRPTRLDQEKEKIKKLSSNQLKLYQLIFDRALATQMKEAEIKKTTVTVAGTKGYEFQSEFQQVTFDGFLRLLQPSFVEKNSQPVSYTKGAILSLQDLELQENQTKHPPRYNEASLIKTLEEKGIGRPSTYSSIISLIIDKHYLERESRYLIPTKVGNGISNYLAEAFPEIFNLNFTAEMENSLDAIAEGEEQTVTLLKEFYGPFEKELEVKKLDTSKLDVDEKIDEKCPECGGELTIKYSKWGKFYACSNYPKCRYIKSIPKLIANSRCGKCGAPMVARYSKSGKKFFGCSTYPDCDYVAWSLMQARDPEKFAQYQEEQAKKKKARQAEKGTTKAASKSTTKKSSAKKSTVKKSPAKKSSSNAAGAPRL